MKNLKKNKCKFYLFSTESVLKKNNSVDIDLMKYNMMFNIGNNYILIL